jgi:hypothetical protein
MPKSKHRKNHSKKIKARKERALQEKRRTNKIQREMFNQIQKEMLDGKFNEENLKSVNVDDVNNDINIDDLDLEIG